MTDVHAPPSAIIERPGFGRRFLAGLVWLIPLTAVGLSIGFAWLGTEGHGPLVEIHAEHGHGLDVGDDVRYLGIVVGEVRSIGIGDETGVHRVLIEARLHESAAKLARVGTEFWVVRPQLTLDSVEGVDTIIGARYLALDPGPPDGEPRFEFTALEDAPIAEELTGEEALEVVLEAPRRFGLQTGAGITYRGVRIGSVVAVGLASDATSVEVSARIRAPYMQLVRERSVFWETGGFELGLSLTTGLQVDIDSLRNTLIGGIEMATPVDAGPAVSNGARFELAADAEEEWLEWAPALPLGSELLPPGAALPKLVRASLRWREGRVLRTDERRSGWMLVDESGLVGPADLLAVPEDARGDEATLEIAGRTFDVGALEASGLIETGPDGATAELSGDVFESGWEELKASHPEGASQPRRPLTAPEDLLVVRAGGRDPSGIDATRLRSTGAGMEVDDRIPFDESWHGAVLMARRDGAIVGMLRLVDGKRRARIVPLP